MLPSVSSTFSRNSRLNRRKPRKPRGRGLRSNDGCTVCRARHVKCDESRPVCGPCRKRSLNCVFVSDRQKDLDGINEIDDDSIPASEFPSSPQGDHENGAVAEASDHQSRPQPVSESLVQAETGLTNGATVESPQLHWASPNSEIHVSASPQSVWNPSCSDENAPLRWFGLLVGDAGHDTLNSVHPMLQETNEYCQRRTLPTLANGEYQHAGCSPGSMTVLSDQNITYRSAAPPHDPISVTPGSVGSDQRLWEAPVKLLDHEIPIFKRFTDRLSHWMDIFDPLKHFSTLVPHIALSNEGLMKAVLGLAARHMSIKPCDSEPTIDRTTAVQYYYETLHYLQDAMKHQSYTRSLELTVTAHIVSMYEMIDGSGSGWERHLKGVFWIQRSQSIGAETPGLKGAGWWAWLRQDVWAAFRERRRIYSIHKHVKTYAEMNPYDRACRAVYLLAEAVNYSSDLEVKAGEGNLRDRIDRADYLSEMIDEWFQNLTVHFRQLPLSPVSDDGVFKPIWINPPEFGAAVQMANLAKVLILVHKPAPGGLRECLGREQDVSEAIDTICGIALNVKQEPTIVLSTQCLFAAGLYTQHPAKRQAILELLGAHQDLTGWPVNRLEDELKAGWAQTQTT